MSRHVTSCHVMSCHVKSCHLTSSYVLSNHVMSCHVMSCHVMILWNLAPESFLGGNDEVFETVALCGNPARSDALAVAPRALRACRAGVGDGATWASFCVAGCGNRACRGHATDIPRVCRGAVRWELGSGRLLYTRGQRAFRVAGCRDRACWEICRGHVAGVPRVCRGAAVGIGFGTYFVHAWPTCVSCGRLQGSCVLEGVSRVSRARRGAVPWGLIGFGSHRAHAWFYTL